MVPLEVSPNYDKNYERYGEPSGTTPCLICGRPIKDDSNPAMLRTHHSAPISGVAVVTNAEAEALNEAGEGGFWPIGADCLRKHPEYKPYVDGGADATATTGQETA